MKNTAGQGRQRSYVRFKQTYAPRSHSALPPPADLLARTRRVILDAAEALISRHGVEGTSVRQIVNAAGVNLGAINYHFGTKELLVLEVLARRLEPMNRERLARLDALEAGAGRRKLKLEEILEALVRPAVESPGGGADCDEMMRLISRCVQEPNAQLQKFVAEKFEAVASRFEAAILRAVPSLPPEELYWRMQFIFGALHFGQERWLRFEQLPRCTDLAAVKPDREGFIQRFIAFAAAGMSSPRRRPFVDAGTTRLHSLLMKLHFAISLAPPSPRSCFAACGH